MCLLVSAQFYAVRLLKLRSLALNRHRANQNCTLMQCCVRSYHVVLLLLSGKQLKSNNRDYNLLFESVFHSWSVALDSSRTSNLFPELHCRVVYPAKVSKLYL